MDHIKVDFLRISLYKIYFLICNLDLVFGIILLKHSSDSHFISGGIEH
jgi:hypothetical protein